MLALHGLSSDAWQRFSEHGYRLYTVMIDRDACGVSRDKALSLLHELGIGAGVHYIGVHLQPFYASTFGYRPEDLPNATWISERTLSIPLSPHMSDEDVDDVIAALLWIAEGAPS